MRRTQKFMSVLAFVGASFFSSALMHSDADASSLHVDMADEAYHIGQLGALRVMAGKGGFLTRVAPPSES